MSLSSTQARLIALASRMSDVEYEGQQINQQRLTLANKMADIWTQMENMVVPCPPNPQDYMKTVYSGKAANGETVNVKQDADGGFNYTKNVKGQVVSECGLGRVTTGTNITGEEYTIKGAQDNHFGKAEDNEADFYVNVDPIDYTDFVKLNPSDYTYKEPHTTANPASSTNNLENAQEYQFRGATYTAYKEVGDELDSKGNPTGEHKYEPYTVTITGDKTKEQIDKEFENAGVGAGKAPDGLKYGECVTWLGDEVKHGEGATFDPNITYTEPRTGRQISGKDLNAHNDRYNNLETLYNSKKLMTRDGNGEFVVYDGKFPPDPNAIILESLDKSAYEALDASEKGKYQGLADENAKLSGITAEDLNGVYVIQSDGSVKEAKLDDILLSDGTLDPSVKLIKQSSSGTKTYVDKTKGEQSIAGNKTMSIAEAEKEFGEDATLKSKWEDAILGLRHTYPDNVDDFKVVVINGVINFFMAADAETTDNGKGGGDDVVQLFTAGFGTYEQKIGDSKSNGEPQYDETGNLKSINLNGQNIALNQGQELDDVAYKAAEAEYTKQKATYDKEQSALNAKTSAYHQADKKLDLMLKRLDTERNALQTEMDALKKVIQDSIESGFKTFSG